MGKLIPEEELAIDKEDINFSKLELAIYSCREKRVYGAMPYDTLAILIGITRENVRQMYMKIKRKMDLAGMKGPAVWAETKRLEYLGHGKQAYARVERLFYFSSIRNDHDFLETSPNSFLKLRGSGKATMEVIEEYAHLIGYKADYVNEIWVKE